MALLVILGACSAQARRALRPDRISSVMVASWYGGKCQGRQTASGEVFDLHKLTAAHKSLPFGTNLRVTHIENERSVIVKVNDRGPFINGRSLDLSRAAAAALGMVDG